MRLLSINEFLQDQAQAVKLSDEAGIPYSIALRNINRQHEAEKSKEEAVQLPEVPDGQLLINEMAKYARERMGTIRRKDMPQMDATTAQTNSSIPTGPVEFVKPDTLTNTQDKINKTKVKSMALDWDKVGKTPVLISSNNWILDGHHRVEAARSLGKLVRVVRINLPGRQALNKIKEHCDGW